MKKTLLIAVSIALVCVLALGGTIAYLQDTDSDVNVMTMGNVSIEQIEQERDAQGNLVEFTQGKPALPAVYEGSSIPWADAQDWPVANNEAWKVVENNVNVVDKFVTVKNTGVSDAFVRTVIAFETGKGNVNDPYMHFVCNDTNNSLWDFEWTDFVIEIDGSSYAIGTFTYSEALAANDTTVPSVKQVYLDKTATNDVCKAYGETFEIFAISQAVQADGFANASAALDEAFGAVTAAKAAEWFGDITLVEDADGLVAALENGKDVVLTKDIKIDPASMSNAYGTTGINVRQGQTIYGNGHTLDIKGAGGTWDSGICTSGGTIKDLTVTGSFRGIFIKKDATNNERVILDNVTTTGTTYTISVDSGTGKGLTAKNSKFYGWTSYAGTIGDAEFIDCYFGEGSGYSYCRPYAPTAFIGCEFEADYTLDPRAAVTFENCTLEGVALTDANIADLVTDTNKVTIK